MSLIRSKRFKALLAGVMTLVLALGFQSSFAEDVAHMVKGVVKSVDKDSDMT